MRPLSTTMVRIPRWLRWTGGAILALVAILLLVLATFPWGLARDQVAAALAERYGTSVSVGEIERRETFSFAPTLIVRDVRIAQPEWAGSGDLLHLGSVTLRLRVLPLLVGRTDVAALRVQDGRATLIRDGSGRRNWAPVDGGESGGPPPDLRELTVRNLAVEYRDAVQKRQFLVNVASDPDGFRATGTGAIDGRDVRIQIRGPRVSGQAPWPFRADIRGADVAVQAHGTMERALDTDRMTIALDARADDLKTLDRIVEAGLFGTQPVRLRATIRHGDDVWSVDRLEGSIGRSRIAAGQATVGKRGDRTTLDAALHFATLDFSDLSTDAGQARAAAEQRRTGPRLLPSTKVNLAKLDRLDGTLSVRADRLLSRETSALRTLAATLRIERKRLTVDPLTVGLSEGRITGTAIVDQGDRASPDVTLRLDMGGARISTFAGTTPLDAPVTARVRLKGRGDTIRSAMARADGSIGIYGAGGRLPARLASLLGADVARGVLTDADKTARVRCLCVRLAVRGGRGEMTTMLVDTSRARTTGRGSVRLADETMSVALTGIPKQRSLLWLDRPVRVSGPIHDPTIAIPPGVRSAGGILRMLGRAIGGERQPISTDADCGALRRQVLR